MISKEHEQSDQPQPQQQLHIERTSSASPSPQTSSFAEHRHHYHHGSNIHNDNNDIRKRQILIRRHTSVSIQREPPKVNYISFGCGLIAGTISAGLFNPMDRALYLSVKNRVPFLSKENFLPNPYQGFLQSVGHRALAGGLYFPLEHFFMTCIPTSNHNPYIDHNHHKLYHLLAGMAAGTVNAILVNPFAAVKYKTWGRSHGHNRGILTEIYDMHRKGGLRPLFVNGLAATILRDLTFGGCYTSLRLELHYNLSFITDENQWIANVLAASVATVISGPFNLARNIQYSTKSKHVSDSVVVVLQDFNTEISQRHKLIDKLKHVQNRLRLGWGTIRVAGGMAFGQILYDELHGMYQDKQEQQRQ